MGKINVSVRLRPIRFAFLARPNDRGAVQRIFEINTCLWGGMYNPIIPYFERVPSWWSRDGHHFYGAREIVEGYLNYFEPDFVIEAEKGLGKNLGLPDEVVTSMEEFRFDDSPTGYKEVRGLTTFGIYKHLYHKEFRFVQRHKHNIIVALGASKKFKPFISCIFGCFPSQKNLEYLARGYRDAFAPEQVIVSPHDVERLYRSRYGSPLAIGCTNLDVFHSDQSDPMVFLLDATQSYDLVDFWNLRAYKKNILAVPIQWFGDLSQFCREFAVANHRPLPGNDNGIMIRTTFAFSRSLTEDAIKSIKPALLVDNKDAVVFQHFHPDFWAKKSEWSPNRPVLTASTITHEVTTDREGKFKFDTLDPEFVHRYSRDAQWANVVHLTDGERRDQAATVFPASLRNPSFPRLSMFNKRILSTTEGLTVYPDAKGWYEWWTLLDGTSAFIRWFESKGTRAEISDAGKTLLQVMKSLRGLWGVSYISHPVIVGRLNAMACKLSRAVEEMEDGQQKEYPSRTVTYNDLRNEINAISEEGDIYLADWKKQVLESLVESDVIRLGIEVKCTTCDHRTWYALDSLGYELRCENCLKPFSFPQANPSNRNVNWCFRVIGPFAQPDYAQGAYTSALALRFCGGLGDGLRTSMTWSTSMRLTLSSQRITEADFLLWSQRKRVIENDYEVDLAVGESKSYARDSFEDKDLARLRDFALEFPGSILICASMKDQLGAPEKNRIAKLALWGRKSIRSGSTRAPVIVLTAAELFSRGLPDLRHLWTQKGGRRAKLVEPAYIRTDNLRVLADLTQQVYLDLPSYHAWSDEEWNKRRLRRAQRRSK